MSEISLTPSQTVELALKSRGKMRQRNLKLRHTLLLKQNFKTNYQRSLQDLVKMRETGESEDFEEEVDNFRQVLYEAGMKQNDIQALFNLVV